MNQPKKLIEVALPLPQINDASAYDKMPGIGPHPKGIHPWWARLPLPTARAILFASVVDDPAEHPDRFPAEEAQNRERDRLFDIIRALMEKKLHEHPEAYRAAHAEMLRHCDGQLPTMTDPFAGGGSIPLEAQRLGFAVRAGDLNPVAVLINKALLEIAPAYAGLPPVNPEARQNSLLDSSWTGTKGLADDVRYYSQQVLEHARTLLAQFYPTGPGAHRAIAWLWCRTVASPNPACGGAHVPLLRSLKIATKKGQSTYLEPVVNRRNNHWRFRVTDKKPALAATVGRKGATCILTNTPIPLDYIRSEGRGGRLGLHMTAVVANGREYHDSATWPTAPQPPTAEPIVEETMPHNPFAVRPPLYGLTRFSDIFTPRQLHSLHVFSDLVRSARDRVLNDAAQVLDERAANGYADAIATFLAFALDRCVDFNNSLCRWSSSNEKVMGTFGRQAIPMIWDFAEANILSDSVGSWKTCSEYVADCVEVVLGRLAGVQAGKAEYTDATDMARSLGPVLVSTDPPYYNNIDYSDLSDFFYVWLRRSLSAVYPPRAFPHRQRREALPGGAGLSNAAVGAGRRVSVRKSARRRRLPVPTKGISSEVSIRKDCFDLRVQ